MIRTRAAQLTLVNWKGVFFQKYDLDPHVTALEGANGAGKTTVMIAAYVVLLPDMTRLKFTNVGESGATGGDKGLFGRLGEPGRPSYAALDLALPDGERVVAVIHLERRTEPTVELTPFIITRLDSAVALHDVLLDRGDRDAVPELARVRELVSALGGHVRTFHTSKDYFAALFDYGVTPLRLTTDDERSKYNEMLRTSMVGGISRALTGGLRDFLLREEADLANTLRHMRSNLDACRRTRLGVQEARALEHEIYGVFEAGQTMFAAATHATERRAAEMHEVVQQAQGRLRAARARHEEVHAQHHALAARLNETQDLLHKQHVALADAQRTVERTRRANVVNRRVQVREAERHKLESELHTARLVRDRATEQRDGAKRRREEAREDRDAAAQGLADFQAGFSELARRAEAHRLVREQLERARAALPELEIDADSAGDVRRDCEVRIARLDADVVRLEREAATAAQRHAEFHRAFDALERITDEEIFLDDAFIRGRQALTELRQLEQLVADKGEVPERLERLRTQIEEQARARQLAAELAHPDSPIEAAAQVQGAFQKADADATRFDEVRLQHEAAAQAAAARLDAARSRVRELTEAAARWSDVRTRADRLEARTDLPVHTRADLDALLQTLQSQRDQLREQRTALTARREQLEQALSQLEQAGGHFDDALLLARDLTGGHLLAALFEDVPPERAPLVQALLGPLTNAIVVDDVEAAARKLVGEALAPETVWLVDQRTPLPVDREGLPPGAQLDARHALAPTPFGARLTRLPAHPSLGRAARERQLQRTREEIKALSAQLESLNAQLRAVDDAAREANGLQHLSAALDLPNPQPELDAAQAEAQSAAAAQERAQAAGASARQDAQVARARRDALARLMRIAHLLDLPDAANEATQLEIRLARARAAELRLKETRADRELLEANLDALRVLPPEEDDLEDLQESRKKAEKLRDRLALPARALRYVEEHRNALDWADAERALAEQRSLAPALREQLDAANIQLDDAEAELDDANHALDKARLTAQNAESSLHGLSEALNRDLDELDELRIDDPGDDALARAEQRLNLVTANLGVLQEHERDLNAETSRLEERLKALDVDLELLSDEVRAHQQRLQPALDAWESLKLSAEQLGILRATQTSQLQLAFHGLRAADLWPRATQQLTLLIERLQRTRDGVDLVVALRELHAQHAEQPGFKPMLEAWLLTRGWLRRRVPPQIAEVEEPLDALGKLREHLARLEDQLANQERALRGHTSDVARSIDTQIRRARQQLNRLNTDLATVRFGSIRGVRIRVALIERMEHVLRALREDEAQLLLFQSEIPIEDAMDELFKRYGGGRNAGQRLLDYREYLDLRVEVQRQASSEWEPANPSRLSTGEAIGVGAAVMMVVLTAWERDANIFRNKRTFGTLRLLFLDEATRLSQDNLGILFDLCQNLELQLIIAAPEVARAEGNTTYRLVRQVDQDGRELVLVSGRRTTRRAEPVQVALN